MHHPNNLCIYLSIHLLVCLFVFLLNDETRSQLMHNLRGYHTSLTCSQLSFQRPLNKTCRRKRREKQSGNSSDVALPRGGTPDYISLQVRRHRSARRGDSGEAAFHCNTANAHQMAETYELGFALMSPS